MSKYDSIQLEIKSTSQNRNEIAMHRMYSLDAPYLKHDK